MRLGQGLREAGIDGRVVSPKRMRSFAPSTGRLAKEDPSDPQIARHNAAIY